MCPKSGKGIVRTARGRNKSFLVGDIFMSTLTISAARKVLESTASASGPLGEKQLVEAAKRGDHGAFDILCHKYSAQLVRSAFRVTRNAEDAEDAVQDALLSAFVHLRAFDGRSSFSTWLTRIAINSALMLLRKRKTTLALAMESADESTEGGPLYEIPDLSPSPESQLARREEHALLDKAIKKLRPSLRNVIELQHLEERSIPEAAKAIGISVVAVKSRIFHAKAALRKSPTLKFMRRNRFAKPFRILPAA